MTRESTWLRFLLMAPGSHLNVTRIPYQVSIDSESLFSSSLDLLNPWLLLHIGDNTAVEERR